MVVHCKVCGKQFNSFRGLNGHMNAHLKRLAAEPNVGATVDDAIMDAYLDEGESYDDAEIYARRAMNKLKHSAEDEYDPSMPSDTWDDDIIRYEDIPNIIYGGYFHEGVSVPEHVWNREEEDDDEEYWEPYLEAWKNLMVKLGGMSTMLPTNMLAS